MVSLSNEPLSICISQYRMEERVTSLELSIVECYAFFSLPVRNRP